jgi:hypothetical protein
MRFLGEKPGKRVGFEYFLAFFVRYGLQLKFYDLTELVDFYWQLH